MRPVLRRALLVLPLLFSCAESAPLRAEALDHAAYRLDAGQAILDLSLVLRSRSEEPVSAHALEYDVRLEEETVAVGSAAVGGATGVLVPAGGTAALQLPLTFGWDQLPTAVVRRLERGGALPVQVRGNVLVRVPGRTASVRVPFDLDGRLRPVELAP